MNFLESILDQKKEEVRLCKKEIPLESLKQSALYSRRPFSLTHALTGKPMAIIAEVKKASPSKNVIRRDFDPIALALEYVGGGASAISVLTDRKFFQGDIEHLRIIRGMVSLPLLRKDFIIDDYQLHESKAAGADAVLLIVAALSKGHLEELMSAAMELGLETLVEVHTMEEAALIRDLPAMLVGINNRDLTTFQTDLTTTFRLLPAIGPESIVVSESGIANAGDIQELMRHGIHAALIGESLLIARSPGKALRDLLSNLSTEQWLK